MFRNGKNFGICVAAFGFGLLTSFFLPDPVLIVLQAMVIVTAGILCIKC